MFKYSPKETVLINNDSGESIEAKITNQFKAVDGSKFYELTDSAHDHYYRHEWDIDKLPPKPIMSEALKDVQQRIVVNESTLISGHVDISMVHLHKDEVCFVTKPITVNKYEVLKMMLMLQQTLNDLEEAEKTVKD